MTEATDGAAPIRQFQSLMNQWLAEFCEARGLDASLFSGRNVIWDPGDIEPFLRSLDLFESLGMGKFRWQRGYSTLGLFGHGSRASNPRPPTLARETVAVMGAVADLHDLLGWPAHLIEVETKGNVFDFAAYRQMPNGEERMVIAGEAKASARGLDTWLASLRDCIKMGHHEPATHLAQAHAATGLNAHKKRTGLLESRAGWLWLVALGARRAFPVSYVGNDITLGDERTTPDLHRTTQTG